MTKTSDFLNSDAIRFSNQRDRMRFFRLLAHSRALRLINSLFDMPAGNRAVGADVIGRFALDSLAHHPKNGPADFHRIVEVLRLNAPRPIVPGAALDGRDLRARDE